MKKVFRYDFQVDGQGEFQIDYDDGGDDQLEIVVEGDSVRIFGNSEGLLTLARICVKLAMGDYDNGYRHLSEDFDADLPDPLPGVNPRSVE